MFGVIFDGCFWDEPGSCKTTSTSAGRPRKQINAWNKINASCFHRCARNHEEYEGTKWRPADVSVSLPTVYAFLAAAVQQKLPLHPPHFFTKARSPFAAATESDFPMRHTQTHDRWRILATSQQESCFEKTRLLSRHPRFHPLPSQALHLHTTRLPVHLPTTGKWHFKNNLL